MSIEIEKKDDVSAAPVVVSRFQLWTTPLLVLALITIFWPRIQSIIRLALLDSLYSASLLVPIISAMIGYQRRSQLDQRNSSAVGLVLVAVSVVTTILLDVTRIRLYSTTPLLLILSTSGVIVLLWGWKGLRTLLFPVLFLLFLIPVPEALRTAIDYPLQEFCARITVYFSHAVGIQLQQAGATLLFPDPALGMEVAPVCNGLRSTMALLLSGVLYLYLVRGRWYQKACVFFAIIPLAYIANFLRLFGIVSFLSWGGQSHAQFEPLFDHVFGALIFVLAIVLLFMWARAMKCAQFRKLG